MCRRMNKAKTSAFSAVVRDYIPWGANRTNPAPGGSVKRSPRSLAMADLPCVGPLPKLPASTMVLGTPISRLAFAMPLGRLETGFVFPGPPIGAIPYNLFTIKNLPVFSRRPCFANHHAPLPLPRPVATAPTRAVQGKRVTRSCPDGVLRSSTISSVAASGVPWLDSRPSAPSLRRTIPISTPHRLAVHGAKSSKSAP